jgi:hypothetical protein
VPASSPHRQRPLNTALGVIHECPDCEVRYLDERRCPDCNLFCRRIDHDDVCPHCDEPVDISDLHQNERMIPMS